MLTLNHITKKENFTFYVNCDIIIFVTRGMLSLENGGKEMTEVVINKAILSYHEANRYETIFQGEGLLGKKEHIKNVIKTSLAIADFKHSNVDREFLAVCAEHHDDGRVDQYRLLGKFWDNVVTHNALGLDRFDQFLLGLEEFTIDQSVNIFRDVILYHGRMRLANLSPESKEYVEIVTAADDFENACSCVSYLVHEVETDAKGYISQNPEADQTEVSNFVFDHFKDGVKFDKMKYCKTYAEYVLFVATLATSCIKKYGEIAKVALQQPGYGYDTILAGYKDVFRKTFAPEMGEEAYKVLASMIR